MNIWEQVKAYRASNPRSRVVGPYKFVKNTSATKQRGCVLCGETGPTWSAKWGKTVRAIRWELDHAIVHGGFVQ